MSFKKVLLGLNHLHKNIKIIHRDIKPSNLLVNSKGEVKIADFGVSGKITNTNDEKKTFVGTAFYMSPERLNGQSYNYNTDLWSFGLTIMELYKVINKKIIYFYKVCNWKISLLS